VSVLSGSLGSLSEKSILLRSGATLWHETFSHDTSQKYILQPPSLNPLSIQPGHKLCEEFHGTEYTHSTFDRWIFYESRGGGAAYVGHDVLSLCSQGSCNPRFNSSLWQGGGGYPERQNVQADNKKHGAAGVVG